MDEAQMLIKWKYSVTRFDLTPLVDLSLKTNDEQWFYELTDRMDYYRRCDAWETTKIC